jgi:hypothetical protein
MSDVREMSWGRLVLMLQARAQSYKNTKEEPEEATFEQVAAFFGA